ncbi:hypothetical protein JCM3770_003499 [Rhodotorula araucariae]
MFANRRPPPKAAAPSPVPASKPAPAPNTLAVPRAVPSPSSPLSSVPSSSSPPTASPRALHPAKAAPPPTVKRTTVQVRTTTVVRTVQRVVPAAAAAHTKPVARTLNAYKRPADAPPLPGAPAPKRAVSRTGSGKGRRSTTASGAEDAATLRRRPKPAPSSSELDPLTPSEDEDDESELSSVDEDYFAKTLTKEEGAPVCARDVAAKGDGDTDGKSGESLVLENRAAYKEHFLDPQNPERPTHDWAGSEIPTIELEYPGLGVKERFALLAPKTDDEYNPIEDVLKVILTVLDHFLTKEEAFAHFGHQSGATSFSAFLYNRSSSSTSRAGTPATPTLAAPAPTVATALDGSGALLPTSAAAVGVGEAPPLIRELEKARAKRDGPAFLAAIARYNCALRALKADGTVARNIAAMRGVREKVWTKVFLQCYDRAVGPEIDRLKEYEAFSDNVYGELLPKFMNEM